MATQDNAPESREDHGSIQALAALYQGEKTDASYVFNTAMAMMGIAVAYLVGATPFTINPNHGPNTWLFLLLLPIPLWIVAAYHSLITLNAMSHGVSVRIIEDELFVSSGLGRKVEREMVGSAAGDKIMDITQERLPHKIITIIVYGGVGFLVIGFTIYSILAAHDEIIKRPINTHPYVIYIAATTYSLLLTSVIISWATGLQMINKGRNSIKSDVIKTGNENDHGDLLPPENTAVQLAPTRVQMAQAGVTCFIDVVLEWGLTDDQARVLLG